MYFLDVESCLVLHVVWMVVWEMHDTVACMQATHAKHAELYSVRVDSNAREWVAFEQIG